MMTVSDLWQKRGVWPNLNMCVSNYYKHGPWYSSNDDRDTGIQNLTVPKSSDSSNEWWQHPMMWSMHGFTPRSTCGAAFVQWWRGQDTTSVDVLQCPVSVNSDALLKNGVTLSHLGQSVPVQLVFPQLLVSPISGFFPQVHFGDAAPDSWKRSDAVSDSLNTGGIASDYVKPSVS